MQTSIKPRAGRGTAAFLLLALPACGSEGTGETTGEVEDRLVYGTDDRLEYGQVTGTTYQTWADSTAALVNPAFPGTGVSCSGGTCTLSTVPFTSAQGSRLCSTVRYINQPQLASCTGFLVGPKLLATAGHCISSSTCANNTIVFGFTANASGTNAPTSVPDENVYECVNATSAYPTEDWALVELDRPVPRPILNVRYDGAAAVGLDLAIIGHPMGLPMKISPTGEVTATGSITFSHNVESFSGNSGSPVFSRVRGSVEAIHVTPPASHWVSSTDALGPCVTERVCPTTGCPGFSGATLVTRFSDQIPLAPAVIAASAG